jgi:DNA-directed RNA polymerase sigma subunit (sigma70/sigma32)
MTQQTRPVPRTNRRSVALPSYVKHGSFTRPAAPRRYDPSGLIAAPVDYDDRYMPDDVTRDHARRMHYAAHRMHRSRTPAELRRWHRRYLTLRDRIVLGNRKLIYRAVRRRMAVANRADDLIGDCHIVLIHAVAAFNPWLGIRFSTYAYTCLVRALARQSQRHSSDWLARALPLTELPGGEPGGLFHPVPASSGTFRLDEFLRDDHPLLTQREKVIITRRFCLREQTGSPTLETVGAELGLSKERVRQVQASALDKLRKALLDPAPAAASQS